LIGSGIGVARVLNLIMSADSAGTIVARSDTEFDWQGIADISKPVIDRLALDLTFRYPSTNGIHFFDGAGQVDLQLPPGQPDFGPALCVLSASASTAGNRADTKLTGGTTASRTGAVDRTGYEMMWK